jgi:hypothetical protein
MLNPEALTSTAKVRIAPTTRRKMLTPILIASLLDKVSTAIVLTALLVGAPVDSVRRMKVTPFDLCAFLVGVDRRTGGATASLGSTLGCPASAHVTAQWLP